MEGKTVWAGVAWKGLPNTTITGAVYKIDVSKVAAYAKAKNARLTGLSCDDAGFADTQRGVITGVQHRF